MEQNHRSHEEKSYDSTERQFTSAELKSAGERGVHRRVLGNVCIIVGLILTILTGLPFFDVDASIIWPVFTTGTALLGVGLVKDYSENKYVRRNRDYENKDSYKPDKIF